MTSEVLKSELIVSIDAKRKEMIEAAEIGGYTSEKAIKCSQELDMYLNKYHQVLLEEENNTDGPFLQFVKTKKMDLSRFTIFISARQIKKHIFKMVFNKEY